MPFPDPWRERSIVRFPVLITSSITRLGQNLISGSLAQIREQQVFTIPWLQIGGIVLAAYLFSLLTTVLPALQASRIYPAEALRYE